MTINGQSFFIVSATAVRVRGMEIEIVHGNGRLIVLTAEEAHRLAMQQGRSTLTRRPRAGCVTTWSLTS